MRKTTSELEDFVIAFVNPKTNYYTVMASFTDLATAGAEYRRMQERHKTMIIRLMKRRRTTVLEEIKEDRTSLWPVKNYKGCLK